MAIVLMYESVCPICRNTFRHSGQAWTYKRRGGTKSTIFFCSWTCIRKYDKQDGRKKRDT